MRTGDEYFLDQTGGCTRHSATSRYRTEPEELSSLRVLTRTGGNVTAGTSSEHRAFAEDFKYYCLEVGDRSASFAACANEPNEARADRPKLVRKRSGEVVRPALRLSHRHSRSLPSLCTPIKTVRFEPDMVDIRHFFQSDHASAVSVESSTSIETCPELTAHRSYWDDYNDLSMRPDAWELHLPNFPRDTEIPNSLVRLQNVWLSVDRKSVRGTVVVANLAFQKHVVCRFTFDYWRTVSEVTAEYSWSVCFGGDSAEYDQFKFDIELPDLPDLDSKILLLCVRYSVWDNNHNANFHVAFRRTRMPESKNAGQSQSCTETLIRLYGSKTHSIGLWA